MLFLLLLLGFLVNFILKPLLKEESGLKTKFSSGVGYWTIISLLLIFIVVLGYFIIYLPFESVYLTEFNFQDTNSVTINADKGMLIFLEIDSGAYTREGTQLQISLISNSFNSSITKVIGKQTTSDRVNHKRILSGTNSLVFMKEEIPSNDEYTLTIEKIYGNTSISNVRVYGKITN
jgi:hypothetical protein